jgi:hypothetical protein
MNSRLLMAGDSEQKTVTVGNNGGYIWISDPVRPKKLFVPWIVPLVLL